MSSKKNRVSTQKLLDRLFNAWIELDLGHPMYSNFGSLIDVAAVVWNRNGRHEVESTSHVWQQLTNERIDRLFHPSKR